MIQARCTYDDKTHTYKIGGQEVISVTQALVEAGLVDTKWFTDYGRRRGSAVHKAIQYRVEGSLDLNSIDPKIEGYLSAWDAFVEDTGYEPIACEKRLFSAIHRAAGTLDHLGNLRGKTVIADVKTGALNAVTGIQLTGYAQLARGELGEYVSKLIGLQLKIDGSYKMRQYIADFQTWGAALQVARWKRENK